LQELKELHRDDNPDILVEANEVSAPAGWHRISLLLRHKALCEELCTPSCAMVAGLSHANPVVISGLQENIFELHFAIRGAWETEFEVRDLGPVRHFCVSPRTRGTHFQYPVLAGGTAAA
jgi:hypothetical protein